MTLEYLQNYWWLLISVLGALLVFLLFVQGGQSMILTARTAERKNLIANSMGRKWELTFTTLVVFGGAFFASFPLFYSTSFGGAYWLWILILFTFVGQAVSYEYRRKKGNVYGTGFYDVLLFINGSLGCILLGVAVAMFFFGADFTVTRGNLLDAQSPVISQWGDSHGFEAIFCWKNLVLGFAVLFLARTLGCLYMMNNITEDRFFFDSLRKGVLVNGLIFVVFFLWFLTMVLLADGFVVTGDETGRTLSVSTENYHYFHNYVRLWWAGVALLIGVVMVLYAVGRSAFTDHYTKGIWWAGFGVFFVVASLFWVAGYSGGAYYPSLTDEMSSLTIRNSSSSEFTLTVMSWVSIIIPFVLAYIWYAWASMDRQKLTTVELNESGHKY